MLQRRGDRLLLGDLRNQQIDAPADDLGLTEAKDAFAGRIEGADRAVLVDSEYHILDVIQNDLQVLGALLTRLTRHGARFIGHEAHRLDNAATLLVDRFVVSADESQELAQLWRVGGTLQPRLAQLGAQVMVQMDDFLGALEGARGNFCGVEGRARSRGV